DAGVVRGRVEAGAADGVGRGQHRPPDETDAELLAEGLGDLLGLLRDLVQGLLAVERLAPRQEPDLGVRRPARHVPSPARRPCSVGCGALFAPVHSGDASSACWPYTFW